MSESPASPIDAHTVAGLFAKMRMSLQMASSNDRLASEVATVVQSPPRAGDVNTAEAAPQERSMTMQMHEEELEQVRARPLALLALTMRRSKCPGKEKQRDCQLN